MIKFIKKIYPITTILLFIILIYFYYNKNHTDFYFIKKINLSLLAQIIFLSFLYLITEGFILRNIVTFLNKKISILESFFVMNLTYFCNTFVQFTGLGFRIFYLKKTKDINIKEFIRFSLDTIACEVLVFSFLGLISLLYIDITSLDININNYLYIGFIFFFFSSLIYLLFLKKITLIIKNLFIKMGLKKMSLFFDFFLIEKEKKKFLYFSQIKFFVFQFIILFLIFFLSLKEFGQNNFLYLSLITTSLVDFSFLLAFTPYSIGVTELLTFVGTRDIAFSIPEIVVLINLFRLCMLSIYFVLGPIFFIKILFKKK